MKPRPSLLLLAVFLLTLAGCGLPVFVTLNMPERVDFEGGKFTFAAGADNDEVEFRGFELYYHIYPQGTVPATDRDLKSREELLARGFRRVSRISDRKNDLDKPLISIDPGNHGTDYTVTADFSPLADATEDDVTLPDPGEAAVTSTATLEPPGTLTIRRGVFYTELGSEEVFKRFNEFAASDADISSTIYSQLDAGVPLLLYALSFGRATDFTEVYSVPLWLGELDISFPTP